MTKIVLFGAVLGFLGAVGVYFEPAEPYPGWITLAGTLGGVTIALLISTMVSETSTVAKSVAWGGAMGLLATASVFFAKGGWTSWDAPFAVPTGVVTGAILGPTVRWLRRRAR